MSKTKNSLQELYEESLDNIRDDRDKATSLLKDVANYIGQTGADRHREAGMVAAKYLEVLQKSNEQLVKIMDMRRKGEEEEFGDLEDSDKDDIYSELEAEDAKAYEEKKKSG